MRFFVGLDLGQRRDHSAIAVVERIDVIRAFTVPELEAMAVRFVERAPLGTPYPKIVEKVREVVRSPLLAGDCALAVDGTGVGAPVVEMLKAAGLGCDISAVTITGGERENTFRGPQGQGFNVPKQDLIAGLQVLMENGELRIAKKMRDAGLLVRELTSMRTVAGRKGGVKMSADGVGEHDDLVIAVALACWRAKRKQYAMFGNKRLPGI